MIMLSNVEKDGRSGMSLFVDISSIFIVIGGIIASLLINFKKEQIALAKTVFREAFYKNDQRLPDLINLFVALSERARREGILALENELDDVDDELIRKVSLWSVEGIGQ